MSDFRWATVTGVAPLRVQLDGDVSGLPITPDALVYPAGLGVGTRVRCELSDSNHVIVLGASNGADTTGQLTAASGYTVTGGLIVKHGRVCTMTFQITNTGGANLPAYTLLATLPSGFFRTDIAVQFSAGSIMPGVADYLGPLININTSGSLTIYGAVPGSGIKSLIGSASWVLN